MVSKSKKHVPVDKRTEAGGKIQSIISNVNLGSRRSSAVGLSSGGESSRSTSDEDPDEYVAKDVVAVVQRHADSAPARGTPVSPLWKAVISELEEFSPALGRPDRVTTIRQVDGTSLEDFVVRVSETDTHVLMMGSPSMMFYPLRCPFKEERCASFRARAPQYIKEHLESKHQLRNVQVNLACPCPAVCNMINGVQRECQDVKYDPLGGVLESHIQRSHLTYFKAIEHSLCIRNEKEKNLHDVPDEVRKCVQHLETGKKLPDWTREDPQCSHLLFPSQVFPEKVILQAIIKDKNILYTCNIPPCRGDHAMVTYGMSVHLREAPGHDTRIGYGSRFFQRCPKCNVTLHWSGKQMLLHVRAMHPEVLGEPANFTEAAKAELAMLVGQIKGKIIGRAIGDTAKPGDDSDGTKAHYLYSFRCHMPNCKQFFSERDHLEWHITADHQPEWNKSGTSDKNHL